MCLSYGCVNILCDTRFAHEKIPKQLTEEGMGIVCCCFFFNQSTSYTLNSERPHYSIGDTEVHR